MTLPARSPVQFDAPSNYPVYEAYEASSEGRNQFDEARLIELARQNPALFAPIYELYFDRIYAYCLRRCENTQEVEDLCSQVFTRALVGLHTYRGGMFAAWLFQIAHHVVVNHYRKTRAPLIPLDDIDMPDENALEAIERDEDGRILQALVATLPDDQRDLLALMLDAELTSNEIGLIVGKSAGAVRTQAHRIIKGLRERYIQIMGDNIE